MSRSGLRGNRINYAALIDLKLPGDSESDSELSCSDMGEAENTANASDSDAGPCESDESDVESEVESASSQSVT